MALRRMSSMRAIATMSWTHFLDPFLYGGDEMHNLGLCAKAWSFDPGESCPKDWMNCPLRHWMFEPEHEQWVLSDFWTRAKRELPLPMGPPHHPLVNYEGYTRHSFYHLVFRSSREGYVAPAGDSCLC